jgi:predicted permease
VTWRWPFRRRRGRDAELRAELRDHVERLAADYVRDGVDPDEARRRARLMFGGDDVADACRDERRFQWIEALGRDLRLAVRGLRHAPMFTVIALTVLTLGIGATTTIFSVVDAVVLRALPFPDADRLVAVSEMEGATIGNVAPQNFVDWTAQQRVFASLAAVGYSGITLKGDDAAEPETLVGQVVTANFFETMKTPPLLGRPFTADNERDGHAWVAVISYRLWQRRFGGAPDVIGRQLPGPLGTFQIVGVMPPGFSYPVGAREATDVWTPLVIPNRDRVRGHEYGYYLHVIGRLRDEVTVDAAQAQMDQIAARLKQDAPSWYRPIRVQPLHAFITGPARTWMLLLLGVVVCVLLIACVNLATLMLVRATTRSHELGIRSALGASRWDLGRALLVESLVLSLAGAAIGVLAARLGVEILRAALPVDVPRVAAIAVNGRVLVMTVATALLTGLAVGLAPVWHLARRISPSLRDRARGHTVSGEQQRLRSVFLVTEIALAAMLVVGAGLFLASFARVSLVDLGVDTRDVLTVRVRPYVGAWNAEQAQRENGGLLTSILQDVQGVPGVETAALVADGLPFRGDLRTADFSIPGRTLPERLTDIDRNQISPDYFRVLRVPLRRGRLFTDADRQGAEPVVILNEEAARIYFPNEDPLGQIVSFQGTRRVVGIVGNIRHDGPETNWRREGFVPIAQSPTIAATLVLRTSRSIADVLPPIKTAIRSRFPDLALPDIEMLGDYVRQLTAQRRVNMLLLGLFGVLGLAIAAVGLYGVMAYLVTQRTPEIGIRMALGAQPSTILRSVLVRALRQLAAGLAIGLAASWLLSTLVKDFLFRIEPHDVRIYAAAVIVLLLAGLAAALLPARRAARVDPLIALRLE